MPVYYLGPHGRITETLLELGQPRRSFCVRAVQSPFVARGPRVKAPVAVSATVCCSVCSAGAVVVLASWPVLHISPAMALAVLVAASTTGAATNFYFRRARWYQLWALYEGRPVLLFESADGRVFGQISRAVLRCLEARDT